MNRAPDESDDHDRETTKVRKTRAGQTRSRDGLLPLGETVVGDAPTTAAEADAAVAVAVAMGASPNRVAELAAMSASLHAREDAKYMEAVAERAANETHARLGQPIDQPGAPNSSPNDSA